MLMTNSTPLSGEYPLRAASTGLWSVIVDVATGQTHMFGDTVMMRLLGLAVFPGPKECYDHWFSRIHKDCVPYLGEMIAKVLTAGKHDEVEYTWLHPEWGEMHVRCGGWIVECRTGMVHTMGYHQDISELRYLRRHLEEALFRLRALADLGGQGIFEMELHGGNVQVLDANAIFREQFGYVADDDMPVLIASNMPKEDREQWLALFSPQEWEAGKRKHFRVEYAHPEKGRHWLEITCECFRNENGTIKFVGHSYDMSVWHKHETLLLQAKVKSEEALLAHNACRSAGDGRHFPPEAGRKTILLSKQGEGSPVDRAGPSLAGMFADMLQFEAIEATKVKIEKKPFNLHRELGGWVPVMELWARHKGLSLRVLLDFTLPEYIEGDSLRMRQVLCNLCDNAIKFTDSGEILLSIRGTNLETDAEGRYRIVFMVCDAAYLSHRPQKRLAADALPETSRTRWTKEAGLDIGSSRHLVKMMGGILTQETMPDKGISFRFALDFNLPRAGFSR